MKIEFIIPTYYGLSLVKNNLPLVLEVLSEYKNIVVTVIDDGSGIDERKELEDFIKEISNENKNIEINFLYNEKNLGFASTINKAAFASNADLLYFLNSDVFPKKRFLDPLLKDFSNNNNLFGVGSMDESIEKDKVVYRGRGIGKWERGMFIHCRGEVDKSDTLWISGGSSLIRHDLFVKFGGFDSLYNPFYWEDIDLSYRVQKAGYDILFENKSVVIHKHLEGAINKNYSNFQIKTIVYRNQFIFVWKDITDLDLFISHLLWLPYHKIKALFRRDFAFFYGLFLAMIKIPVIIIKRKKQKKLFVKKDKEILERKHI